MFKKWILSHHYRQSSRFFKLKCLQRGIKNRTTNRTGRYDSIESCKRSNTDNQTRDKRYERGRINKRGKKKYPSSHRTYKTNMPRVRYR